MVKHEWIFILVLVAVVAIGLRSSEGARNHKDGDTKNRGEQP